jgi:hypothetical protein
MVTTDHAWIPRQWRRRATAAARMRDVSALRGAAWVAELAGRAAGPVDAEDSFSSTDLSHLGMRSWQMPVMLRQPGPVAEPALNVIRVRTEEDLRAAERAVIAGFELARLGDARRGWRVSSAGISAT